MVANKKKPLYFVALFTVALSAASVFLTCVFNNKSPYFNGGIAACSEGKHVGNHYSEHLPTILEPGNKGFYICCSCHSVILDSEHKEGDGTWTDQPSSLVPAIDSSHRAYLDSTLNAAMVMESIDNIPETADYKGVYNGLVDPFTERADELYNAYIEKGGSASDITNLAKLTSTKDSLSMYDVSADKKIDASVFSPGSSVKDPVKDYVNSGYKFVTKVDIGQYVSICSFDKAKAATFKDQLTGATSISFALKVSNDVKLQPQISYNDGAGGTAYKAPSGVTETKAGEWLFLTLDSTWVNLLVSDSFKLFYVTTMTGASATAGLEVTVADMYIDKTVTAKKFITDDGWSVIVGQTWSYGASGSIAAYDSTIFAAEEAETTSGVYPFIERYSKTNVLTANEAVTADTNVYIKGSGLNQSVSKIRLIFYVSGEMTVSNVTFHRSNDIASAPTEVVLNETVTYTTGWHYLDTTSGSTQWYGFFNFTISAMTKGSTLSIATSSVLKK